MTEHDNVIVVENVSKTFRIPHVEYSSLRGRILHPFAKTRIEEFEALDDVSFEVRRGEFFGIVGRNGSGKSTLLKAIAGIYKPDSGRITVSGSLAPFIELGVGFNPELSGRENVFINGALLGLSTSRIKERYDAIVDFAELERFMDLKLRNFSSGMQVRLAFAIALEAGADILLTDEVLAVGDENFQRKCFGVFRERKAGGSTVLFVTHDMSAILDFCDRTMLLEHGRMTAIGDTREVVRRYHQLNVLDTDDQGDDAEVLDTERAAKEVHAPARIEQVRVHVDGEDATAEPSVPQGSRVEFEVVTSFAESLDEPIIGLLLTDRLGKQVVNTNTYWVPTSIGTCGAGSELRTRFAFDNILSAGEYFAHAEVALAGPGPVQHGLREALQFTVTAEIESHGVVDLPIDIAVELSGAGSVA
jgi:ABC-type polysaccharide/polyol phosphate transport system ATPase subunit